MRLLVVIMILAASPVFGDELSMRRQGPPRAAWEWSVDDRLAQRFEPTAARSRLDRAVKAGDWRASSGEIVVIGRENPELLLGFELMDHLTPAFDSNAKKRRNTRERMAARATSLHLADDFWERLERVAQPFLDSWVEQRRVLQMLPTAADSEISWLQHESQRLGDLVCSSRVRALAAAREEFGRDAFDQFLYRAVAPDAIVIIKGGDASKSLLWMEGGCQ